MTNKPHKRISKIKNFFSCRQHPIIILSYTTKYLWLLIIPLAKYLIATSFDLQKWIKANWVDILTISVIIGYAVLRWVFVYFKFEDDCIVAHTGYFGISETRVYFSEISSLSLSQGYFFRMIKACTLFVDTDAKSIQQVDITLDITEKQALQVYEKAIEKCHNKPKYIFNSSKFNLIVFSFLFSSTLSGVIIVLSVIYEAYRIVGREAEQYILQRFNTEIDKLPLIEHIPKYFLWAGIVIGGGWLISFLSNLFRHWNFSCTRCSDKLLINSGLGAKRRHVLIRNRINYIDFRQSLLMKAFKICSVSINCTGYGKRRLEISALIPITTNSQADSSIKILMPGVPEMKADVKTGKEDVRRFITMPIVCCLIPPAAAFVLIHFLPNLVNEIKMIAVITLIPLIWLCAVKFCAAFITSIALDSRHCMLSYCTLYAYHKIIVETTKISKISVSQNPFQRISKTCTVRVYMNSESTSRHTVRGLNYKLVTKLLNNNGFDFDGSEFNA